MLYVPHLTNISFLVTAPPVINGKFAATNSILNFEKKNEVLQAYLVQTRYACGAFGFSGGPSSLSWYCLSF